VLALVVTTLASSARADDEGDYDPLVPGRAALRWRNQLGEARLHGAAVFSTPAHQGRVDATKTGWEAGYDFGSTPTLKNFRVGGVYGLHVRMVDDKTFTASPYYELDGGLRWGVAEIYSFYGVSWATVGVSHAKFALGLLSPRVGIAVGARLTTGLALHAYASSEFNWGVLGFDDYRAQMLGVRLTFLSPPAPPVSRARGE
jgi:hypothetical protein